MMSMEEGIQTKFSGQKNRIEDVINHIEKEFFVIKNSDWKPNDRDDGCHIYAAVLPKQVVKKSD